MSTDKALVLIVDDEPPICDVVSRFLEKEGYDVIIALEGETAIKMVEEKKPNVVLLDLMMPGLDGREVCQKIRELSTETQVIYFAAVDPFNSALLTELRHEADELIIKPASHRQIVSKIHSALRKGQ